MRMLTFQIAAVAKSLQGHRTVLDDEDTHIQHKAMGRKAKLHKKGNVVVMRPRAIGRSRICRGTTTAWTSTLCTRRVSAAQTNLCMAVWRSEAKECIRMCVRRSSKGVVRAGREGEGDGCRSRRISP